jgi:carbamoyl-phosphate synthase large subunit
MTTPGQRRPPLEEVQREEEPAGAALCGAKPAPVTRVLVTGAGGPAAIAAMKSLRADMSVELLAADMDPWASGLYLVPPAARTLIPAGGAADFTEVVLARCRALGVHVLLPTVDAELRPLAAARDRFAAHGIELLLAPAAALDVILDKLVLARHCAGIVRVPRTEPLDTGTDPASWSYPVVVKPRSGSGSRGFLIVSSGAELAALAGEPGLLVQELLPGEEYSIDVLADAAGRVIASVPRLRARVDSGVSVGGRTVRDAELESFGRAVAEATGITFVANVQCKRDAAGRPALLEVNPRMPGTLGLTIASGVDMPRLALDSLRGQPVPAALGFREVAVVRFLDERVIDPAEIERVGAALTSTSLTSTQA